MSDHLTEQRRFAELVDFYANGSLEPDDMAFMEDYLRRFPKSRDEITFTLALRNAVQQIGADRASDEGLEQLLQNWSKTDAKISWRQRMIQFTQGWGLTPAFGVASTVVVIQAAVLWNYSQQHQVTGKEAATQYRSVDLQNSAQTTDLLKVVFRPQTPFADILTLLNDHNCQIISGPSESGEIWLVPKEAGQIEVTKQKLLDSGMVDDVTIIHPKHNK